MNTKPMQVRLALREEGSFWNAYLAQAGTMDGAKLIGGIMIGAARKNPEVKAAFQALMQQVLADAIEDVTGAAPKDWETMAAPEIRTRRPRIVPIEPVSTP